MQQVGTLCAMLTLTLILPWKSTVFISTMSCFFAYAMCFVSLTEMTNMTWMLFASIQSTAEQLGNCKLLMLAYLLECMQACHRAASGLPLHQ